MSLPKALSLLCLAIALVCLAGGYALAAQWLGAGLVLLAIPAALLVPKYAPAWVALACLVGLAAAGLLAGAPAWLMIPGATAALAAWDLAELGLTMAGSKTPAAGRQFENQHIRALAPALGVGLLLAAGGRLMTLRIPFVVLVVLVLLALFSLDRAHRHMNSQG